jgi:membrane-bound lytic murein transglycosylase MltF
MKNLSERIIRLDEQINAASILKQMIECQLDFTIFDNIVIDSNSLVGVNSIMFP